LALARVPELRKISILTVIVTVTLLVLAAIFPRLTVALAILAIIAYSAPYVFFVYLWPRRSDRNVARGIWVRDLTPEAVKGWYEAGKLTREEYEKMMRDLETRQ